MDRISQAKTIHKEIYPALNTDILLKAILDMQIDMAESLRWICNFLSKKDNNENL